MRRGILLVALVLVGVGCGTDDGSVATEPATATPSSATPAVTTIAPTTAATTSSPGPTTTTVGPTTTEATTTTTIPSTLCPIALPIPEGSVTFAAVGGDFDGDGNEDALQTYQAGADDWRVRITFADGGNADAAVAGSDDFAPPRPIGGFDVDGDGPQEAFLTVASGASVAFVGLYDVVDCVATRVSERGLPAEFAVGGSVGSVSGISCDGVGTVNRVFAQYVDDDVYEGGFEPFLLEGSVLTPFPGDGAGFTAEEASALGVLACGLLSLR